MKIFISWSGRKSRTFVEATKPWLEQVLPGTDGFGEDVLFVNGETR